MNKAIIAAYVLIFTAFGGWCANIYKIIDTGFEIAQWGGMEVGRIIGVFVAPLGAVLGFF
ncbi:TMhelix containing protein [Vibrio phage 1.122.B._10N.286.46.F8]|nr:TMhelix containing protein [Vibrio phage 1.122.A._10N.286.46.F8]AUR89422.1 TMhelix containing protein [Vibrio phage 1.122.B._10N.286.46.F8]